MTLQQIHELITQSAVFKKFISEHKDAELVAGFFILDFLSNETKKTLDYKIDSCIFTFELDKNNEVVMKQDKLIEQPNLPKLEKILPSVKIEIEELRAIAEKQAIDNNIKSKFHKIIAVLQNYKPAQQENKQEDKNQQIWNLTCMLEEFIILNILINSDTGEIIKFQRKSMMDFIKKV